jgi:hypothetical protein
MKKVIITSRQPCVRFTGRSVKDHLRFGIGLERLAFLDAD